MGVHTCATPVMVVRSDGSVGMRMGDQTATRGLFVVADCPACTQPADTDEHCTAGGDFRRHSATSSVT